MMSDVITESRVLPVVVSEQTDGVVESIDYLDKRVKGEFLGREEVGLGELLNKVLEWEGETLDKLSDKELDVLTVLSSVLGTINYVRERKITCEKGQIRNARLESVKAQQEILKIVFSNLSKEGKPNRAIVKSFSLVCNVFHEFLNPGMSKIQDPGVQTELGFWQGIGGMITSCFLFQQIGWEVRLPSEKMDLENGIDLVVRNSKGEVLAVDVTAKMPRLIKEDGFLEDAFRVSREIIESDGDTHPIDGINGTIRINVPPLNHYASDSLYADRTTFYPSAQAFEKFSKLMGN